MPDPNRVSVATEPCSCGSVHASFALHRDFPDVRIEGESPKSAAQRLAAQMTNWLDDAQSDWRRAQICKAIEDVNAFAAQAGERASCAPTSLTHGPRSMLVGLDGTSCSAAAVGLGIQWAHQFEALLVGLAIIDEPTIAAEEPVYLGGVPHADPVFYRERMADANRQAAEFLEKFALQCAEANVACKVLEDVGLPAEEIALEGERYDLILMGQRTRFHFEVQEAHDDTLVGLLKRSPRPVVVVPEQPNRGDAVIVAYDGSLAAARALYAFQNSGVGHPGPVYVVSVDRDRKTAMRHAERAHDFLWLHQVHAVAHPVQSDGDPAGVILNLIHQFNARLVVMGPRSRSPVLEFLLGSTTRRVLQESLAPVFLFH